MIKNDFVSRLKDFRKKRQQMLAKTPIYDADGKLPRCDSIENYFLHQAWKEISDNLQRFYH